GRRARRLPETLPPRIPSYARPGLAAGTLLVRGLTDAPPHANPTPRRRAPSSLAVSSSEGPGDERDGAALAAPRRPSTPLLFRDVPTRWRMSCRGLADGRMGGSAHGRIGRWTDGPVDTRAHGHTGGPLRARRRQSDLRPDIRPYAPENAPLFLCRSPAHRGP